MPTTAPSPSSSARRSVGSASACGTLGSSARARPGPSSSQVVMSGLRPREVEAGRQARPHRAAACRPRRTRTRCRRSAGCTPRRAPPRPATTYHRRSRTAAADAISATPAIVHRTASSEVEPGTTSATKPTSAAAASTGDPQRVVAEQQAGRRDDRESADQHHEGRHRVVDVEQVDQRGDCRPVPVPRRVRRMPGAAAEVPWPSASPDEDQRADEPRRGGDAVRRQPSAPTPQRPRPPQPGPRTAARPRAWTARRPAATTSSTAATAQTGSRIATTASTEPSATAPATAVVAYARKSASSGQRLTNQTTATNAATTIGATQIA